MPYGGIDVKSMDGDFCERIGGKSVGEMAANFAVRAPLTPKTIPFFDEFRKRTNRAPVYTAFGANDAVLHLRRGRQARRQHRHRRGDQGAREDQLRSASPAPSSSTTRTTSSPARPTYKGPSFLFAQWRDGCKREVVHPKELRTADFVYPAWIKK